MRTTNLNELRDSQRGGPFDPSGKLLPTYEALRKVEADYPHASDARKWRLAQAQTLIHACGKGARGGQVPV